MATTQLHLTGKPPYVKHDDTAVTGHLLTVEQTRELIALTRRRPWQGDHTVIHITGAHRVREPVWNALLKPLEEPPDYVQWHLYAPSTDAIPSTIRSRSHVTREHLPDPIPEDASRILRMCETGDALVLLREADRHQERSDAISTLFAIQHYAVRRGDVDTAVLADHHVDLLSQHVSSRVVMKSFLITLAIRRRS